MGKSSTPQKSVSKSKTSKQAVGPKETRIVVEPKDMEKLQELYAKSHGSTGEEVLLFVIVLGILICGFFAAHKLF